MARLLRHRQTKEAETDRPGLTSTAPHSYSTVKPLRAGMPGDSGVLVVTRVRSITTIAHEAAGALGIRHSPRPLWAEASSNTSGASRREDEAVCETIATSLRAQRSNPSSFLYAARWIASLRSQ